MNERSFATSARSRLTPLDITRANRVTIVPRKILKTITKCKNQFLWESFFLSAGAAQPWSKAQKQISIIAATTKPINWFMHSPPFSDVHSFFSVLSMVLFTPKCCFCTSALHAAVEGEGWASFLVPITLHLSLLWRNLCDKEIESLEPLELLRWRCSWRLMRKVVK